MMAWPRNQGEMLCETEFTQTIGCTPGNSDDRVLKLIMCDDIRLDIFCGAPMILSAIRF